MTNTGFSKTRLARLHDTMAGYVERGEVPGIVTLVSRRGEMHVDVIGTMSDGGSSLIQRDTIFRISSMTKPVTAVATMILVEECRLRLDDPVDDLLPELAGRRVLTRLDGPLDETVPAHQPITVRDLLTFRLGYGLVMGSSDDYPILKAIDDLGITGFGPPNPATPHDPDEWLRRLGTLPLMHQPGEQWMYNTGAYVLGVLIARASGQPLETFFRERIFEPLGMRDTSFSVPASQIDRLPDSYIDMENSGTLKIYDATADSQWSRPPAFPDGGAGLVSTIDDYLAFGQMLLDKGRHGNQRVLSRLSVDAMTTDKLTPEQRTASGTIPIFLGERGWGLGMAVFTHRNGVASVPGRFGWDGGLGTSWYADPHEDLVGILMSQRLGYFQLFDDFWTSVYQAIDD